MAKVELKVKEREGFGSAESRRLRKGGWIPGVLYSEGKVSTPLAVDEKSLKRAIGHTGGAILTLTFEGKKKEHPAIVKELQANPLGKGVLHIDFMEVRMDRPIESPVRLELTGTSIGQRDGGILDQSLREVTVRCLPADIPEVVQYGIDEMNIGDSIKIADLTAPKGCEIMNDPEAPVASIIAPRLVVEEVTAEEEEAAAEEAAEGAAEAAPEAQAEAGEGGEES